MQPSAGSGQPPTGPDWMVELAWTGHRCVAYVDPEREPGRRTRLLSANDVSMTAAYPELGPPLERRSPPRGMVLDGTVVARGEEHAPRARLLTRRSSRVRPSEGHIRAVPVDFQVADLLWLDGHSAVDLPYRDRRGLLEGLGFDAAPVWSTAPLPVSELDQLLRIADAKGVDALHARHLGSRYKAGGRSPLWLRLPVPRTRQVVVGGWTPTDPAWPEAIASLLLGVPDEGGLRYVGRVGVSGEERRQVAALHGLRRGSTPFADAVPADAARDAIWVEPRLAGKVEFAGWLASGRMRLPRWRGLVPGRPFPNGAIPSGPRTDQVIGHRAGGDGMAVGGSAVADPPPTSPSAALPTTVEPATAGVVSVAGNTPVAAGTAVESAGATAFSGAPTDASVETRRLEQHFVYNALNTIAALIRTDPGRARELLFGFADLSRAADQSGDAATTLGRELAAVRGYLQLEQARFGRRLRVELDVGAGLHHLPVRPLLLLDAVRAAVQQGIEPLPDGGVLAVVARPSGDGCTVMVRGGDVVSAVINVSGIG